MPQDRDRRPPSAKTSSPPARDSVEKRAEQDVAAMKKVLQRTKAEVARSKTLADNIERRTKPDPDSDKKK